MTQQTPGALLFPVLMCIWYLIFFVTDTEGQTIEGIIMLIASSEYLNIPGTYLTPPILKRLVLELSPFYEEGTKQS